MNEATQPDDQPVGKSDNRIAVEPSAQNPESKVESNQPKQRLQRRLGTWGAIFLGMGSIIGTGVFVSIGLATSISGGLVLLAIVLAAGLAACNGLNSAQLAASHPVSGGTYEYGYRYLNPLWGFTAGWLFVCAKSASAATAALGVAGYLHRVIGLDPGPLLLPVALVVVLLLTFIVLGGVRTSFWMNVVVVSIAVVTLLIFVAVGGGHLGNVSIWWTAAQEQSEPSGDTFSLLVNLLQSTALLFVAYTGYGRIATLGEEVKEPLQTIPQAILLTVGIAMTLYLAVAIAVLALTTPAFFSSGHYNSSAPLESIAAQLVSSPWLAQVVAWGGVTALLSVQLNLILGVSRVLLAMGRRGDLPKSLAKLNQAGTTPYVAVIVAGCVVGGIALVGDIQLTWSFSAFMVLIYYAITNASALNLADQDRLFSKVFAYAGLGACAFIAFWVEWPIWMTGIGLILVGWLWYAIISPRWKTETPTDSDSIS